MPRFAYKAKEGPGQWVDGVLDAANEAEAVDELIRRGFTPVEVVREGQGRIFSRPRSAKTPAEGAARPSGFSMFHRVSGAMKASLFRQLGDLVEAGVPILQALKIIERQTASTHLRQVVAELTHYVEDGESLSAAMTRFPDVFPAVDHQVVYAGEISGTLQSALLRLAEYSEREEEMKGQVLTALLYPAFVLVVGMLAVFVLLGWVIPQMSLVFEEWDSQLPWPTRLLMGMSHAVNRFGLMALGLLAAGILYFSRFGSRPEGRLWLDTRKLRLPLVGRFIRLSEMTKFLRTLAALLESGVVIVTALDAAGRVLDNQVFREAIAGVRKAVADGENLSTAMRATGLFPENVVSMLAVGEETGRPADALVKVVRQYEREVEQMVKGFLSLLGPALILIIGLAVAFIVTSLLLPLWQMNMVIR